MIGDTRLSRSHRMRALDDLAASAHASVTLDSRYYFLMLFERDRFC